MKKAKREGIELVKEKVLQMGYELDRYGNYKKEIIDSSGMPWLHRFKLNSNKWRHEVKASYGWVRLRSGFYSKVVKLENGDIRI